ncbi:MAG: 1-acyl-sn-glycerol-3-phosphate acyltransferase [Sphingomonadaceae bacterium]
MTAPSLSSRLVRRVLMALYRWKGWRLDTGAGVPAKCVIAGAPHTSGWDFVFFLGATGELGIRPSYMGKASLFRWPLRRFMFDMGGIAVDRSKRGNYVDQVVAEFNARDELALVLAPEGTRREITAWRSGFYHIAQGAGVPIVPAWVDHARGVGGIGPAIMPTGDFAADLLKIAQFFRSVLPDHPKLAVLYQQAGLLPAPQTLP